MPTYYIHIAGKVQGVGFRPFVYRLAQRIELEGQVSNCEDGVHIRVKGENETVQLFFRLLSEEAPMLASIAGQCIRQVNDEEFRGFRIRKDYSAAPATVSLTPDLAICADCREEIHLAESRRYQYAFTTCTECGPRFSIMNQLPYDREHTSMHDFLMCEKCAKEYDNPDHRRFFSQTNSCPHCAVELKLYDNHRTLVEERQEEIIKHTVQLLEEGKIIAVKGVGGFLLMADATSRSAIETLRRRKKRPAKPLALMYPCLRHIQMDVHLKAAEESMLHGPESPVVLLTKKEVTGSGIHEDLIAPGLGKLGIMLPYTPLFELILSRLGKPVVATSANLSGDTILYKDEDALHALTFIADFILCHNREIIVPCDDSVVQFSEKHHQRILLRRARGFAPCSAQAGAGTQEGILAMGADLKGSFSLLHHNAVYTSQYLGNLSSCENIRNFEYSLTHLSRMLNFEPSVVLTDRHPAYTSMRLGRNLSERLSIPAIAIQHHDAHFSAVLNEHQLLDSREPVLGIIWDGTGFGYDGMIRGGEFLLYQEQTIYSVAEIESYTHIAGDKMAREPRICALSLCHEMKEAEDLLMEKFTEEEFTVYRKLVAAKDTLQTNSAGRLFDAAASLLGLADKISYEGEAAMLLEAQARKAPDVYELPPYSTMDTDKDVILVRHLLKQMLHDKMKGVEVPVIAARFHITLVKIIEEVSLATQCNRLALSGGVFQNSLLVDLLIEKLQPTYQLFFHQQLSPNDECISYGQLSWWMLQERKKKQQESTMQEENFESVKL